MGFSFDKNLEVHMAQNNYYLMHHGVKGMKWGVRRTPAQLGYRPKAGSRIKTKLNDPEFKRKAATAAKVALVIGAAYATHKVINDPKVLAAGKDAITKVVAKSGAVKASTIKNVMNSTEFKAAKALASKSGAVTDAAKTVGGAAGKVLKKIGSEDTRNTIAGIGLMAGTASVLRGQIKDFKNNKPDGDAFDRAVKRTQQAAEIGENINNLARGPKGISAPTQSSTSSSSSSSNLSASIKGVEPSHKSVDKSSKEYQDLFKGQDSTTRSTIKSLVNQGYDIDQIKKHLNHSAVSKSSTGRGNLMEDSKTGKTVRTNRTLTLKDSKRIREYQNSHPNKSLEDTLRDLDLLDREYRHSAIASDSYFLMHSCGNTGWRMRRTY